MASLAFGIGAAIARRLARDGARTVASFNTSADPAERVAAAIKAESGRERSLAGHRVVRCRGGGIQYGRAVGQQRRKPTPADQINQAAYEQMFGTNVRGPSLCMVEFAKRINAGGGAIVNLTSGQARTPMPNVALYAGTKGALEAITRAFAADLGPHGVRVNAIAPGATATETFKAAVPESIQQQTMQTTALGRLGTPEDIADVVAFMLSDDAHWVTGQVLDANGGLHRA